MIITNNSQDDKVSKLERQIKEQKSNANIIAGIYIPNTIINYLVVKGDDNEFYLNKDMFIKKQVKSVEMQVVQMELLK